MPPLADVAVLCVCARVLTQARVPRNAPRRQGYDVVKKIEALGSQGGTPSKEVLVSDCGELK